MDVRSFRAWLACAVTIGALPGAAQAQASIEVVASARRDGIDTPSLRQQIGIAEDGTIAFAATTPSGTHQLLIAEPGANAREVGIAAQSGTDIAINDESIVFFAGSQLQAVRRDLAAPPSVVQDCAVPSTPCGGLRQVGMASDGFFAMTAFDSSGGIYRGRIQKGRLSTVLESVPVPSGVITALGIDVRVGGPMLLLADHQGLGGEVYGAFAITPSRFGYLLGTMVSTRPRGGSEAPLGAVFGGYDTFALMPEQTDGSLVLATPALARGDRHAYGMTHVPGIPVLPLQTAAGGSLDANELGLAAAVGTLTNGWSGLFTFDTATLGATAQALVALNRMIGRCTDTASSLHVLGTNGAGQMAVLARVLSAYGTLDTQVWRVTPTPGVRTTTTYCMAFKRLP